MQQKPASKNLGFKSLLGEHLPIRHPPHKNLFSIKFETGSFAFSKIYEKFNTWANKIP